MITDKLLRLADAQALTDSAAATNCIDLGVARDIGEGHQLFVLITVDVAAADLAGTLSFYVVTEVDTTIDASSVPIARSGLFAQADLTAGTQIAIPIPPQIASMGARYLGLWVAMADAATITITADVVETVQDGKKFHASGFTV